MTSLPDVPTSVSARAVPVMVHGAEADVGKELADGADGADAPVVACAGEATSAITNVALVVSNTNGFFTTSAFLQNIRK
jgi:hypothetical protein